MATKSSKKKNGKVTKKSKNSSQIHHLENLLKLTLRVVDGRDDRMDAIFTNQANKIKCQIKNLK